ncbi:MBL fold metallo-hydrolase [Facklamia sp. DSM 111018]|uniref:MBL fold metallo-hydrolase n=1 Tax=Facklamia lactis TaxID=2749967 RepID=A0ABS0LRP9_9LACT|nr:MBL fold metallo-hydrolase [Facklamia lactis]MBG9980799.1 MBL fold metallo-hydrolase [Facklamia lactis]MBG9986838.1 MBL fold metallo-hydrolase [Facklamia lactis]
MSVSTHITFWSGLNTIGGNIVSITNGNYRIITDFGALVGADITQLSDQINLETLLKKGMIPPIKGIYAQEFIEGSKLVAAEADQIMTIVCLSHIHLDHIGSLGQLDVSIPVYLTQESFTLYKKLVHRNLLPNYNVNWQTISTETAFEHGPFHITFKESDHDTLGASSIFITCPDMKIIHSGDFRLSGFHPEKVQHWALEAQDYEPDILLLEGTAFSEIKEVQCLPEDQEIFSIDALSERKLIQKISGLLVDHPESSFAINFYPQNIQRIIAVAEQAQKYQRKLLLDPNYYYLLASLDLIQDFPIVCLLNEDAKKYLEENISYVTLEDVKLAPGGYIIQIDYQYRSILSDIPAGLYLHSNGFPLGSFQTEYKSFVDFIIKSGWKFVNANVSGHANKQDLLALAYTINPRIVIPWHTFQPSAFANALEEYGMSTFMPQKGQEYLLKELLGEDYEEN